MRSKYLNQLKEVIYRVSYGGTASTKDTKKLKRRLGLRRYRTYVKVKIGFTLRSRFLVGLP
jgi:hypothetical protein